MSETKYEELLKQAEKFYEQQDYEEAIPYYQQILNEHPGDLEIFEKIGDAWRGIGDIDQAIQWYRKILEIDPQQNHILLKIGDTYFEHKENDKAFEIYEEAYPLVIEEKQRSLILDKMCEIGDHFHENSKYENAIKTYQEIIKLAPHHPAMYALGDLYVKLEDYQNAILSYRQLEAFPSSTPGSERFLQEAPYKLGDCYFKLQQYDKALQAYIKYCRETSDLDCKPALDKICDIGEHWFQSHDYETAIAIYQEVRKMDPDYERAIYRLGDSYFKIENYEKALQTYEEYFRIASPEQSEYLVILEKICDIGELFFEAKDYEAAIQTYLKVVEIEPEHERALFNIAESYTVPGQTEKAIQAYLGYCHILQPSGDSDEDTEEFRKKFVTTLNKVADIANGFTEAGEYEKAIAVYHDILDIDPYHERANSNLGDLYFALEQYEEALPFYENVIDKGVTTDIDNALSKLITIAENLDDNTATNIYNFIIDHEEQNELDNEEKSYNRYYEMSLRNLADLYYTSENYSGAFDAYIKILLTFPEPEDHEIICKKIQTIYHTKQEIEERAHLLREEKEKEQLIVATQKKMLSFLTHSLMNIIAGSKGTATRVLKNAQNALGARYQELSVYKILNDLAGLDTAFTLIGNMIRTYRLYIRDSEHVLQSWRDDRGGDVTLKFLFALVFRQTLARILFDELHQSQLDALLRLQTTSSMEEVQESFLTEILTLKLTPHNDEAVFIWLKSYFPVISLQISAPNVFLNFTGIRFNLLFACISEIVYNALKYEDGSKPIEIIWKKQEGAFIFSCQNTFSTSSTGRTGAQKGLSFIKGLTEMIPGFHVAEEVRDTVFTVKLSIENALLEGGNES